MSPPRGGRITRAAKWAAALAVLLLPLAPAAADPARPSISVTGEATVSAPPDMAEIDGGVTTEAKTAREASDTNNRQMSAVIAGLKKAGIDNADIRTSRLSLQPEFPANRLPGFNPITGYRATNHVTIRVHDVGKVADTIDTLIAAGANDLGNVNLEVSNASKLLDDARPTAIADARRKAEIYARAAGVSIGAPLSISEQGGPVMLRGAMGKAMAPTPIAAGDETLTVTVNITYEIKPAAP